LDLGDVRIVSINGGLKDNAIPAHSQIIVATEMDIENAASEFAEKNRIETDNNLSISVVKTNTYDKAMSFNSSKKVADFLHNVPNGIIKWSDDIEGLVETSLNLGVLKTEENCISASFALRSSVNAEKMALLDKLEAFVKNFDGEIFSEAHYPAWEYKKDSFLRDTMVKVYEEMYGDKPQVVAIHAGLECGLLSEKIDGLDAVSIGPNMMDIHTPREKISVASVERVYKYLLRLLEVL